MLEGAIQGAAGGGSVVNCMRQCLPELDSKEQEVDDQCYCGYEGDIDTLLTPVQANPDASESVRRKRKPFVYGGSRTPADASGRVESYS
jgi:hypothetical protein